MDAAATRILLPERPLGIGAGIRPLSRDGTGGAVDRRIRLSRGCARAAPNIFPPALPKQRIRTPDQRIWRKPWTPTIFPSSAVAHFLDWRSPQAPASPSAGRVRPDRRTRP